MHRSSNELWNKIGNNHGAIITSPDRKAESPETHKNNFINIHKYDLKVNKKYVININRQRNASQTTPDPCHFLA